MQSIVCAVVFVAVFQGCYGASLVLQPYNETALGMFLANDFDQDGVISLLELESSFDKYDANGDGTETRREYTEFICATSPGLYQLSHYLFDEYDMNGDHHLRKEDYDALFAVMDTDSDGSVTSSEFIAYWEVVFPKYENVDTHGQTFAHGQSACH